MVAKRGGWVVERGKGGAGELGRGERVVRSRRVARGGRGASFSSSMHLYTSLAQLDAASKQTFSNHYSYSIRFFVYTSESRGFHDVCFPRLLGPARCRPVHELSVGYEPVAIHKVIKYSSG